MISKKYIPLIVILCLFAIPLIFLCCLNSHFHIFNYKQPNIESFKELLAFAQIIIENIGKRKLKGEVWSSIIYSFVPVLVLIALFCSNKQLTSHGKARWANAKDIETYEYDFKKLLRDFLTLLNPLYLFKPKQFAKNLKEVLKFGLVGKINPIGVNFNDGFLLGKYNDVLRNKRVYYNAPLSSFIVAPPGAGKSAGVIIPNLLHLKTSCVVTDIKGELCDLTAGYRQKVLKNKIYIFNPFGDDNNIQFNPFDEHCIKPLNFNQINRLVKEIANTIFVAEKSGDAHWSESAKNLFIFYALYDCCCYGKSNFFDIARGPKRDYKKLIVQDANNIYLKELYQIDDTGEIEIDETSGNQIINADANAEQIWFKQVADQKYTDPQLPNNFVNETPEQIEETLKEYESRGIKQLDDIVRDYARGLSIMNDKEFASIKSVFNRMMNIFNNYQVRDATQGMSFQYEDLRKENITLYIKIAQTDINTLAPLIRILLESITKNLMTRESKVINERIYMLLDEFIRFGKLEFLTEAPALCRSYNIVPIYVTQDFAMVEKAYSKEDLRQMNGTTAYRILFRMNDYESAELVSKEIGNYTRENRNRSTSNKNFLETSSSYSREGFALITAQDILNIPNDEIIITSTGNKAKPLKLKANFYYKDKKELKKLKIKFDKDLQNKLILKEQVAQIANEIEKLKTQKTIEQKDIKKCLDEITRLKQANKQENGDDKEINNTILACATNIEALINALNNKEKKDDDTTDTSNKEAKEIKQVKNNKNNSKNIKPQQYSSGFIIKHNIGENNDKK